MAEQILASMPGRVLSISVTVGDAVEEDDLILVLEAMKMENEIFCDSGGTVAQILVHEGDTVNTGDVMVVLQ